MIKSILKLNSNEIDEVFENTNTITSYQRGILEEIVLVLEDFATMSTIIQEDKFSNGHVFPLYRGICFSFYSFFRINISNF
jgi:hypothetical protein